MCLFVLIGFVVLLMLFGVRSCSLTVFGRLPIDVGIMLFCYVFLCGSVIVLWCGELMFHCLCVVFGLSVISRGFVGISAVR